MPNQTLEQREPLELLGPQLSKWRPWDSPSLAGDKDGDHLDRLADQPGNADQVGTVIHQSPIQNSM